MLVFVDEAGDTGLKLARGSSRYFVVTLLLFEENDEASAADARIGLLRRELGLAADFEFHFSDTPERIKEAFFEAILPYNFFYFSIVINKAGLYGPGFKFKESFSSMWLAWFFRMRNSTLPMRSWCLTGLGVGSLSDN